LVANYDLGGQTRDAGSEKYATFEETFFIKTSARFKRNVSRKEKKGGYKTISFNKGGRNLWSSDELKGHSHWVGGVGEAEEPKPLKKKSNDCGKKTTKIFPKAHHKKNAPYPKKGSGKEDSSNSGASTLERTGRSARKSEKTLL